LAQEIIEDNRGIGGWKAGLVRALEDFARGAVYNCRMRVQFTKMQGIGNDFVVIDCVNQPVSLTDEQARFIADRHYGVGCDQILLVEPPRSSDVAFRYRILNADGSEVSQCGNGARCFARFVVEKQLTEAREFPVETAAGVLILSLREDGQVTVNMGTPELRPDRVPFDAPAVRNRYPLAVDGRTLEIAVVSMGNPHAVLQVDDVESAPVSSLGPAIEFHEAFPERTNVGFMQVVDDGHIRLRVWERGAGETLACGSGACGAVVAGRLAGLLQEAVAVDLPGGRLQVSWSGEGAPVYLTGPAETVFEGTIEL